MDPEYVADWKRTTERFAAWWRNELADRPPVQITCRRDTPRHSLRDLPPCETVERRWLDPDYAVDFWENVLASTDFPGDAVLVVPRGLGVASLAQFASVEPEFGASTVWITPSVEDWRTHPRPVFDPSLPLFRRSQAVTDALVENRRGRYLLGRPDLQDTVTTMSQMRGVGAFCLDLMDDRPAVIAYRDAFVPVWLDYYDDCRRDEQAGGQEGNVDWTGIVYFLDRGGVVQSDFCALISPELFEDLVVPELTRTAGHLDHALYHLDGPDTVQHLDRLLAMPEITAIQWVAGAGGPSLGEYPDALLRAQRAGKPIQVSCTSDELQTLFELFDPRGVMIRFRWQEGERNDREAAEAVLRRIERWE